MSTTTIAPSDLARRAEEIFDRVIRPTLRPQDDGKFVAIDVASGDYEIDEDDYTAVARIHSRNANAEVWLMRAGFPATCRIGVLR
jgi:hypothetical protein